MIATLIVRSDNPMHSSHQTAKAALVMGFPPHHWFHKEPGEAQVAPRLRGFFIKTQYA